MNDLSEILSSRARAEIFRLLFSGTGNELHIREIQRRSGLTDGTIRQELRKLARLDLVRGRRDSNRVYYRANVENPLFPEIRGLVIKTVGLVDVLREALRDERNRIAFVFGSIARGEGKAHSDVDLMVIGSIRLRPLSGLLSGVSQRIGREINPHILSVAEFKKRMHEKEHFLMRVMESPKVFVIGNQDELDAMG
jgi:DNA-binding transcriptional ArsR family regulator